MLLLYHSYALNVPFDRKVILIREIGVSRKGSTPLGGCPYFGYLIGKLKTCNSQSAGYSNRRKLL